MAIKQPKVGSLMLELLQHLGRTTVAFTVGGNKVESIDELNVIVGVPLVDYLGYLLPWHCRRKLQVEAVFTSSCWRRRLLYGT